MVILAYSKEVCLCVFKVFVVVIRDINLFIFIKFWLLCMVVWIMTNVHASGMSIFSSERADADMGDYLYVAAKYAMNFVSKLLDSNRTINSIVPQFFQPQPHINSYSTLVPRLCQVGFEQQSWIYGPIGLSVLVVWRLVAGR